MSHVPNMPSVGSVYQGGQSTNNSPQSSQSRGSFQGPSSQHSPVTHSQLGNGARRNTSGRCDHTTRVLRRPRLQELVREVDPTVELDEDVEELLLQIADDFIDNTLSAVCALAKHRRASTVGVKDVQLHLERQWNMWLPGFGNEELRPYKRAPVTEAHKQRMALVRKAMKKY